MKSWRIWGNWHDPRKVPISGINSIKGINNEAASPNRHRVAVSQSSRRNQNEKRCYVFCICPGSDHPRFELDVCPWILVYQRRMAIQSAAFVSAAPDGKLSYLSKSQTQNHSRRDLL